jgi:hypothetical protein
MVSKSPRARCPARKIVETIPIVYGEHFILVHHNRFATVSNVTSLQMRTHFANMVCVVVKGTGDVEWRAVEILSGHDGTHRNQTGVAQDPSEMRMRSALHVCLNLWGKEKFSGRDRECGIFIYASIKPQQVVRSLPMLCPGRLHLNR